LVAYVYLGQILAVLGANQQVLQFLQGATRTSLEVNTHGVLGGTLAIFALLQDSGESLLIGSGHNTDGLLVHNSAVAVRADIGQIVGLLNDQMYMFNNIARICIDSIHCSILSD